MSDLNRSHDEMGMRNVSSCHHSRSLEHCPEEIESPEEENERQNLQKKLLMLRKEKLEKNLLTKCCNFIHARTFLSKHLIPSLQETNRNRSRGSKESLGVVKQLLSEKEVLNDAVRSLCENNRRLEKQIRQKKLQLNDLVTERSTYWDEAVTAYLLSLGKVRSPKPLACDSLEFSDHKSHKYFENKFMLFSLENEVKSHRILHLSVILHNLICFSGKPWAWDKDLSDIVLSTGKVLGMNFGAASDEDKRKALENFAYILDNVKL